MLFASLSLLIGCGDKSTDSNNEPSGEPSSEVVDEDGDGVADADDCDDTDASLLEP